MKSQGDGDDPGCGPFFISVSTRVSIPSHKRGALPLSLPLSLPTGILIFGDHPQISVGFWGPKKGNSIRDHPYQWKREREMEATPRIWKFRRTKYPLGTPFSLSQIEGSWASSSALAVGSPGAGARRWPSVHQGKLSGVTLGVLCPRGWWLAFHEGTRQQGLGTTLSWLPGGVCHRRRRCRPGFVMIHVYQMFEPSWLAYRG